MSKDYSHSTIKKFESKNRTINNLSNKFKRYDLDVLQHGNPGNNKIYLTNNNHDYGTDVFNITKLKRILKSIETSKNPYDKAGEVAYKLLLFSNTIFK